MLLSLNLFVTTHGYVEPWVVWLMPPMVAPWLLLWVAKLHAAKPKHS